MRTEHAVPPVPLADLARVAEAQERFNRALAGLRDADVRRPTALPGWTVGHVLTHVARNADSHCRRAGAAVGREVVEQYAGGWEGRSREIETGSGRSAAELVDDVRDSARRLQATWERLPASAWPQPTVDVGGRRRPLSALPGRRWQELEVHLVDLELGPSRRDWSDDFVGASLPRLRESLGGRLPAGVEPPMFGDPRDELAWLYGRPGGPGLPVLAPWG